MVTTSLALVEEPGADWLMLISDSLVDQRVRLPDSRIHRG
jgi:hypothetical protein